VRNSRRRGCLITGISDGAGKLNSPQKKKQTKTLGGLLNFSRGKDVVLGELREKKIMKSDLGTLVDKNW